MDVRGGKTGHESGGDLPPGFSVTFSWQPSHANGHDPAGRLTRAIVPFDIAPRIQMLQPKGQLTNTILVNTANSPNPGYKVYCTLVPMDGSMPVVSGMGTAYNGDATGTYWAIDITNLGAAGHKYSVIVTAVNPTSTPPDFDFDNIPDCTR